jgi:DNA-binding response OmpR family regulator
MENDANLTGMKILVVEDNFLVADMLCEVLRGYGCEIVGPAPNVEAGEKLVDECDSDGALNGALLDVNLNGAYSFPVAAKLSARGIPYIFLTGYGDVMDMPDEFRQARRLAKPCDMDELAHMIRAAF